MLKKTPEAAEILISTIDLETIDVCIVGTSPLICNRMSQKVWQELLAPKGRKSAGEKMANMKHDPIKEFRDSPYVLPSGPTLLGVMSSGFKRSMGTAALRTPGVRKTEIAQLVLVRDAYVAIYGIPKVFMAITRSADINHTPDVRTRALLPEWAGKVSLTFVRPALRQQSVVNLLSAAGIVSGVGDWRQEKGSGSFGSFRVANKDDPDFVRIVKNMGRKAQQAALDTPEAYDDETSEMLAWYDVELNRRGFKVAA